MEWLIDIIKEWLQLYLKGMIVMWHGTYADVPDGWAICDGSNGTPDLRFRFIQGAQLEGAIGETGGEISHKHTFTSNTHDHDVPCDYQFNEGEEISCPAIENGSVDTSSVAVTGTTDIMSHVPTYYKLAFIMKL